MRTAPVVCSLSLLIAAAPGAAQEFFREPELNFWNEPRPERPTPVAAPAERGERGVRRLDEQDFRWEDYEDPSSTAFWDDGGNYVPPRPLRMAAANPTPENVARYLGWQKRKLATIAALQEEVSRQVGAEEASTALNAVRAPAPTPRDGVAAPGEAALDWRRLEILFFYSSECPHCQASLGTVRELEQRGAKVIPVQVDWKKNPPLFRDSVPYTAEIAKEQPIDGVPTWIAAYGGQRFTMQGEVSVRSIEVTVNVTEQQKQQRRKGSTTPEVTNGSQG